jgi:hypothetical protein
MPFGQPRATAPPHGGASASDADLDREMRARLVWQAAARSQVAGRLKVFNANHAMHAWDMRNRVPIAAHAVALLYLDPAAPAHRMVAVAGRLFADTPEVADVCRMLVDFAAVAVDVVTAGADPRVEMSESPEPMSAQAFYYGVAVSTLDTQRGSWQTVRTRVTSYNQVPGACHAVLVDGSAMHAERGGIYAHPEYQVWTTQPMDWISGATIHQAKGFDPNSPTWYQLLRLHQVLSAQERQR